MRRRRSSINMRRRKSSILLDGFDKTQYVDSELVDKVSLWILRIILNLGGSGEFINKDKCLREGIAYFLEVGQYVDMDRDDFKRSDVLAIIRKKHTVLEKRKRFTSSKTLTKNIQQISKLMDLNSVERCILEFVVLLKQHEILEEAVTLLGDSLNTKRVKSVLSTILNIPLQSINEAFKSSSKFNKSSIITIDKHHARDLTEKINTINDSFIDDMMNLDEDISIMIKGYVKPCEKGCLKIKDYKHISKDIDIVIPYLKSAIDHKQKGVNVLLYGLPGTGKTELAKTISQTLKTRLFEVSYADEDDEPIAGNKRLIAFKIAQALLFREKILLMYDEAEDIFDSQDGPFLRKKQNNKAWLNKILESNSIPTIWITNDIRSVDNAILRRFDFNIELPIPNKYKRSEIIKNYSNDFLDEQSIKLLAENKDISPALITRTIKVVSAINTKDKTTAFTQILNNTLKAQGYNEIKEKNTLPNLYDPKFINTTTNLELLTQGIKNHQSARLCLYGAAGTGKSAFGRYIAETLDKQLLLKKGSDLISKWLGETEANIAKAFEEAEKEGAVLVFDEVDSFLADRAGAKRSWEITQVNEMLVQMENFDGVFIATTNLMASLDKASLRRFDLKLEFNFLRAEQSLNMFLSYCKHFKLGKPSSTFKKSIEELRHLTPGDFAAVARQDKFRPINNMKDFMTRLEDEIAIKNISSGNAIGFLA